MLMFLQAFNKIYGKQEVVKLGRDVDENKCSELMWQMSNSRLFRVNMNLMKLKQKIFRFFFSFSDRFTAFYLGYCLQDIFFRTLSSCMINRI